MPLTVSEIHTARIEMLNGAAEKALNRLNALEISSASLSIVRGECHYVLAEWEEAIREFKNALRLSPNSPRAEIMLELATEMIELSRTMRTPASIEQLLAVPNEVSEVPALPRISLPPEATSDSIPSSDEIGLVSETLAELMIRQNKFDDARKVYIQLSRLNPDRYEYFRDKIKQLDGKI